MENKLEMDVGEEILAKLRILERILQNKFRRFENEQKLQDSSLVRIRS